MLDIYNDPEVSMWLAMCSLSTCMWHYSCCVIHLSHAHSAMCHHQSAWAWQDESASKMQCHMHDSGNQSISQQYSSWHGLPAFIVCHKECCALYVSILSYMVLYMAWALPWIMAISYTIKHMYCDEQMEICIYDVHFKYSKAVLIAKPLSDCWKGERGRLIWLSINTTWHL